MEPARSCQVQNQNCYVSRDRSFSFTVCHRDIHLRAAKITLISMPLPSMMYAYLCGIFLEVTMALRAKLKRKSFFVDERALNRAKRALGVKTEAEVIRLSVERVAEMEEFWEFMKKTHRTLRPGSIEHS